MPTLDPRLLSDEADKIWAVDRDEPRKISWSVDGVVDDQRLSSPAGLEQSNDCLTIYGCRRANLEATHVNYCS